MKNQYYNMEDRAVWSEIRYGNIDALEVFYRRYYSLLLNYGIKCTPDDDLVRDCIQELFIKIMKSTKLSDTESPRSYLLKSLRNLIIDKTSSVNNMYECLSFNDEIFLDVIDDSEDVCQEELCKRKALMNALSQLTPQQKHILYLRYIKDFSHKEVAEIMNMNVQSSMNLLSRSLSKLREMMNLEFIVAVVIFYRLFLLWLTEN